MRSDQKIRRFGLYGEGHFAGGAEFVHVETIAARSRLHNWKIAPHIHPNIFQLLYLVEGEGALATDGAEFALPPSTLVIVPCGCVHAFRFKADTGGWVLSIADALATDRRLATVNLGSTVQGTQVRVVSLDAMQSQGSLLIHLLSELSQRHSDAPGQLSNYVMAIVSMILNLVDEVAGRRASGEAQPVDRRVQLVRRFGKLIDQTLGQNWPVGRYAGELGTTAPTLTRACREVVGMPPAQLVLDRRLREAKRALSYTDSSIGRIADDLGFSDTAYFARVFKTHTGVTASAFRKERIWVADATNRSATFSP
jgi:AraC family transcriptional activator of pobA